MNDDERELLRCFREGTCESFSHYQHLHVAWLLLRQHCLSESIEIFAAGAQALATGRGHPEYYHETVTWAYMILTNERIQRHPDETWVQFRSRNEDLFAPDKQVLRSRYTQQTLDSDFARRVFVFPDAVADSLSVNADAVG